MSNIIRAFMTIVDHHATSIVSVQTGNNRANNMGKGLEQYIQNVFAGTIDIEDKQEKMHRFEQIFSYQGNKNNPPDLILRDSDAIEIKKIESKNSALALNSSYPKAKLYADSSMITKACKTCENWTQKDMLYTIGYLQENTLHCLWMIYGDCFCADKETYERIKEKISEGVTSIPDVDFTQTKELGKVKRVDPLGITDLRIRGMWHIENPNKVFDYIYRYDETKDFQLICLMRSEKYNTFPQQDIEQLESISEVNIEDVQIKNPNNPVQLINAKLLTYKV